MYPQKMHRLQTYRPRAKSRSTKAISFEPTHAAIAQVFNVGELLERVLQYLPIEDLFLVRRVSKIFYYTTMHSLPRRMLFLEHDLAMPASFWSAYGTTREGVVLDGSYPLPEPGLSASFGQAFDYSTPDVASLHVKCFSSTHSCCSCRKRI